MSLNKLRNLYVYKTREKDNVAFVRSFKQYPCMDCGVQYEFSVMEFDHCRGKKSFQLSQPGRRSKALILEEIKKCDLVCANCHRLRTLKRSKEVTDLRKCEKQITRIQIMGKKLILELESQILEIRKIMES